MAQLTRSQVAERFSITEAEADKECRNCEHPRWDHNDGDGDCLHADFVGDYGEYNQWCYCNHYLA